ncbi:MAG: hypothetical protein J2P36_28285, partial [Ktedonobacteraceae bacterium]|nr:hypothetical protein [Ktedonobacteraceae bacterium]
MVERSLTFSENVSSLPHSLSELGHGRRQGKAAHWSTRQPFFHLSLLELSRKVRVSPVFPAKDARRGARPR